jgi:hypothetical protein
MNSNNKTAHSIILATPKESEDINFMPHIIYSPKDTAMI